MGELRELLFKPATLWSIASLILTAVVIGVLMEVVRWEELPSALVIGILCVGLLLSIFLYWYGYILYRRQKGDAKGNIGYVDKIIVNAKAQDLLAIPTALQALGELDIEITNKLSLRKVSKAKLIKIQSRLRKDWQMKPSEAYDNLSEDTIKSVINQTAKRMKLVYTYVNEETMMFMMHVAGVLDENEVGLSALREEEERYKVVQKLKARVATDELRNAIRVYVWYSLGINSILLLISYFPAQSVQSMMKMLGKTPTELRAEREQTLGFLITNVSNLMECELHGK